MSWSNEALVLVWVSGAEARARREKGAACLKEPILEEKRRKQNAGSHKSPAFPRRHNDKMEK